ncbi:flavodoxin [Helicobacter turcicus]|uniref:Flavodoxin n=1 Tax=Helicobacter turcicus TaxID=2867412 RepID=A0ABS7JLK3_9HELI|nr:flavodoxin [Helicobacter turcicus]MBX7490269.1 flavodoxin [Helicobacter turcicus]MBX7545152.1 flavodoxin [Helicobacter turcicus]
METIGLFYGSDSGTTQKTAQNIAKYLGNVELHDVAKSTKETLKTYKNLILATPTYGAGNLQGDWEEFLGKLDSSDFANKTIALVGLGDQESYEYTFCNGLYFLYALAHKEGKIIGQTSLDGYSYADSKAIVDNVFVGLIIDEVNQEELTQERIQNWCDSIKVAF